MKRIGLTRRDLIKYAGISSIVISSWGISSCAEDEDPNFTFEHGVASGDPTESSVILWTRVSRTNFRDIHDDEQLSGIADANVSWRVATDESFTNVVNSGSTTVGSETDFTLKVDAQNLQSNTKYFYQFTVGPNSSVVGKTKTLPSGTVDRVKLAVVSCSNYASGYFNVYKEIAQMGDLDAVIHLGDYIYEYADSGYGSLRKLEPTHELINLADYRMRHALHKKDSNSQQMHASLPMIAVWDDHEVANDTWISGAENHDATTEGNFAARKASAIKAYFEWMPIRPVTPGVDSRVYRQFKFGDLVNLLMLDTRQAGRDQQLSYASFLTADGSFDAEKFQTELASTTRTMLGAEQKTWLKESLSSSIETWQVLGSQVLMMKNNLPSAVLLPDPLAPLVEFTEYGQIATAFQTYSFFLGNGVDNDKDSMLAAGLTEEQWQLATNPEKTKYLDTSAYPFIPYNLDAWDGYYYEREEIYATSKALNKNLIVLSGDTHNAWAGRLVDQSNEVVGIQYATASVSAPGFDSTLNYDLQTVRATEPGVVQIVDDLDYINMREKGVMVVTFTPEAAQAEWKFISTVESETYTIETSVGKVLTSKIGEKTIS
mgnify:CR=1 FL=1|tara:strand:- start:90 stop:1892 length:1803 start_codon:yes stop_codon:yes gene_type:complete